jgi:hypothetical protein
MCWRAADLTKRPRGLLDGPRQVIPEAAVEAAADRMVELRREGQPLTDMEYARALLEAAEPK